MTSRALRAALALTALCSVVSPPPARADSACYLGTCDAGTCGRSWSGFSTLIDAADYPDGANTPVAFIDPADGLRHRFVATQEGKIWVWDGDTGSLSTTPFLNLAPKALFAGERGLLAMAVDPDYATTGEFYVFYIGEGDAPGEDGDIVIARYGRSATDPDLADPDSAETILVVAHHLDDNHNGGWLAFGHDGMLYVSLGDGGGGCDDHGESQEPNGQNTAALLGKLLRLDVRGVDPAATAPECDLVFGAYGIPLGNPYAGETAGCGEVWASGLRNPFRFSFDRDTGDLWLGDVGEASWEEINFLGFDYYPLAPDGAVNFGWKCREGCETLTCSADDCPEFLTDTGEASACVFPNDVDPGAGTTNYWDPVLCHRNGGSGVRWQAIIGGYRYRGARIPELAGRYLYTDTFCDQLWITTGIVEGDPAATTSACLHGFPDKSFVYSFAEDHLGELYLLFGSGTIQCLHGEGGGCYWADWGGLFEDDFESESNDTSRWSLTVVEP